MIKLIAQIQNKLGIGQDDNAKPDYVTKETIVQNKYSPKYVAQLLPEKDSLGRVFFHFSNTSDYLALSSNGQLNVRDGEEDLFRAWGKSEFKNLSPQTVLQELEDKIVKIDTPALGEDQSFNSYNEFISWLRHQHDNNLSSDLRNQGNQGIR